MVCTHLEETTVRAVTKEGQVSHLSRYKGREWYRWRGRCQVETRREVLLFYKYVNVSMHTEKYWGTANPLPLQLILIRTA